jgi:hypothetical protein
MSTVVNLAIYSILIWFICDLQKQVNETNKKLNNIIYNIDDSFLETVPKGIKKQ